MAREIGGLGARLKSMFQFNDYSIIDSAVMQGVEGLPVSYRLGDEYILTFSIGPAASCTSMSPLEDSRLWLPDSPRVRRSPLEDRSASIFAAAFGLLLLLLGARAVAAVVLP